MKAIYTPKAAAREYSPLACNLYTGCTHGCRYCYVPACLHVKPEDFHAAVEPRPGILAALAKDARLFAGCADSVLLCFTCDPYPEIDLELDVTRDALRTLHTWNVSVQILTKGGERAHRDFDLLGQMRARFGVTLVFSQETSRRTWEPGAAPLAQRVYSLRRAHQLGIPTFVSVEPIIYPHQALEVIRECVPFTDEFRLGKLNHMASPIEVDWRLWAPIIVKAARDTGRAVLVKDSLKPFLPEEMR